MLQGYHRCATQPQRAVSPNPHPSIVEPGSTIGGAYETDQPAVDRRSRRWWMRRSPESDPRSRPCATVVWLGGRAQGGYCGLQGRDSTTLSWCEYRYGAGVSSDQHLQTDARLQGRCCESCNGSFEPLVVPRTDDSGHV